MFVAKTLLSQKRTIFVNEPQMSVFSSIGRKLGFLHLRLSLLKDGSLRYYQVYTGIWQRPQRSFPVWAWIAQRDYTRK